MFRAAEATAAEARRKYEAAKLAADEAEKARLAAEGLNQEAQARKPLFSLSTFSPLSCSHELHVGFLSLSPCTVTAFCSKQYSASQTLPCSRSHSTFDGTSCCFLA